MESLFSKLFRWALFLAAIGQLKPATLYLAREVAHHHQRGLISLSALNHSLWADAPKRSAKHAGHYGAVTRPE